MTTIGNLPSHLPIVRDPKGTPDHQGSPEEPATSSGRKGGAFATFLSDLSQSTKSNGIAAPAANAGNIASEIPKPPAGEPQGLNGQETSGKAETPEDFAASLLSLAGGAKSAAQPNTASPQVGTKQSQTAVNPDLASLKAAAGEVTGLLDRIAKETNGASDARLSNQSGPEHSDEPAHAGRKNASKNEPAVTSPQEKARAIEVVPPSVATAGQTQSKGRTGVSTTVNSAKGMDTRRSRSSTEEDKKQTVSVSPEIAAGQPATPIVPVAITPVAGKSQGSSSSNAAAAAVPHSDRSAGTNSLSLLDEADLSLDNGAMGGDPTSPGATGSFEMKVTALSAATYFAPPARLSPVQQISDTLTSSMPSLVAAQKGQPTSAAAGGGDEAGSSFQAMANDLAQATQVSAPSIKTLNLQLQPENLGQVTIKLNLSSNGLTIQLDAAHRGTAELINQDKQTLTQKLIQSGYTISSVEVTNTPQNSSQFSSQSSPHHGQSDAGAGQSGGQASGSGGSPNGERQNNDSSTFAEKASQGVRNVTGDEGTAARQRAGSGRELFL